MKSKNLPGVQVVCKPCPLISKIPTLNNPLARRCGEIIENARHIWGYYSPEEQSVYYEIVNGEEVPKKFPPYPVLKKLSARSIQNWYVEHSDLFLESQKTPEATKKAVSDARRYARPSIEKDTSDQEILAIFVICESFKAINDIHLGKPEEAIKEKVLTASTFLNLAKTGFESEKRKTSKQEEVKIKYDKDRYVLFTGERHLSLTGDRKILIKYLFEGRKTIGFLIEKLAETKGKNKLQYSEGNCRTLINRTNNVIKEELGIEELISNEKNKSGFYRLNPKPKEGIFDR